MITLYNYQNEIVKRESGKKSHALFMSMGPQPYYSKIMTPSGWTTMGDIKTGDTVIGMDGLSKEVLGTEEFGKQDVYEVTFADKSVVRCSEHHLWTVNTPSRKNKGYPNMVMSLRQILEDGLTYGKYDYWKYFVPVTEPVEFEPNEVTVDPWLLGAMLGDGGMTQMTYSFTNMEETMINAMNDKLKFYNSELIYRERYHYNLIRVKLFRDEMIELGLHGYKSTEKWIPHEYKYGSVQVRKDILAGILDTDGHTPIKVGHVEYLSASEQLLKDVSFIIRSLGGTSTETIKYVNGDPYYRAHIKLPFNPYQHSFKKDNFTVTHTTMSIRSAVKVSYEPVKCISVVDEHYLTDDFIVTHNSGKGYVSLELMKQKPITKLLVICLVSKRKDWVKETKEVFDWNLTILDKGTKKNRDLLLEKSDGFVINFESSWRLVELLDLVDDSWGIIIDESHMIKTHKSKVTKFALELGKKTPYKACLTGTPQSQGYIDYHAQFQFLDLWTMTEKQFKAKYCNIFLMPMGRFKVPVISGYKFKDKLDEMINKHSVFYKRISPEPTHITVELDVSKQYKTFYKDKVLGDHLGDTHGSYYSGLRQLPSGFIKDERLKKSEKIQWLDDFFKSYDDRVVIFYNFNMERDMIIDLCEKHKRPWSEYNARSKDLTNFNNGGVAICNYMSASTGINDLVISQACIFYSPTVDYILFEQAKKRIDRIGQTGHPIMYYLRTVDSIEDKIYESMENGVDFDDNLFKNYVDLV